MDDPNKRNCDVVPCVGKFSIMVGQMFADALNNYGFKSDDMAGLVQRERLSELLDLCKKFPELHIISAMWDGTMLNRASTRAKYYFVGDGNANPRLVAKDMEYLRGIWKFKYKLLAKYK